MIPFVRVIPKLPAAFMNVIVCLMFKLITTGVSTLRILYVYLVSTDLSELPPVHSCTLSI